MSDISFPAASTVSPETIELALELQQERPDPQRVNWLINDREADLSYAMAQAHLEEGDLLKKPQLRRLHLQKHLRK